MKRLVYTPKAYVFIKDKEGTIHDVTRYVMSGRVTRKVDQVSDAEITLRNAHQLFTVHEEGGKVVHPKFYPMDPITIFLRRAAKRPVRVFTGFCDKTPYLQLFPGPATITASCTLKRLQHTYFDPALPYTQSFFQAYGWVPGPDGQWTSLVGMGNPDADRIGVDAKEVLSIGDSLGQGTITHLRKELGGVTIHDNSARGRSTTAGVDILENRVQRGTLPPVVILNLGTNDTSATTFRSQVRRAINLVGKDRHIVWPKIRRGPISGFDSANAMNEVLEDEAKDHQNLTIVDWDAPLSDGLHPNTAGYSSRAAKIADAFKAGGGNAARNATVRKDGKAVGTTRQEIDGSLSELLRATMTDIGQWHEDHVYIERLPPDLFERMRNMADEQDRLTDEAREEFLRFIKEVVGSGSYGSPDGESGATATGEVKGAKNAVPIITDAAEKYGLPPAFVVAVGLNESGLDSGATNGIFKGPYQQNITAPPYGNAGINEIPTEAEARDLGKAVDLYCRAARNRLREHPSMKEEANWTDFYLVTQGMKASPSGPIIGNNSAVLQTFPGYVKQAKELVAKYGGNADDDRSQSGADPARTTRATRRDGRQDKSDSNVTIHKILPGAGVESATKYNYGEFRQYYNNGAGGNHAGIDVSAPVGTKCVAPVDGKIGSFAQTSGFQDGGMVHFVFTEDVGDIKSGTVIGWGHIYECFVKPGEEVKAGQVLGTSGHAAPHVHFIQRSDSNDMDGTEDPTELFNALQRGEDTVTSGGSGSGTTTDGTQDTENTLGQAAAASFMATLNLPSAYDAIEAALLAGEKSLMNDKPLLPFIQQLTQASLRHFQSLPDGRFYAFYPDYFGEMNQHPPYWEIDDIEILDGKVELSDEALVTHMYVVGDTVNPAMAGTPYAMRSVFSSGVVTIFNAFMAESMLDRDQSRKDTRDKARKHKEKTTGNDYPDNRDATGMNITMDRDEAAGFLERYGARPHVEDLPMIKNPYYEMFLAYQKFLLAWSRQFLTPFTFTFMPELFPGGKVGFPDHSLQMYIEEVTHTWDYESGFTTTATLSAPSIYGKEGRRKLPPNMVEAIIEPSAPEVQAKKTKKNKQRKSKPKPVTKGTAGKAVRPPMEPDKRTKEGV